MSKVHKKKLVIVISIIAVVIAGGVVAGYFIFNKNKPNPAVSSTRPLDQTPDFGSCQITTTKTIREASLGDKITAISEGTRVGVDGLTGEAADGCAYPLSTSASSNNLLTVAVYKYAANKDQADKEQGGAVWTEVANTKPPMYFNEKKIDNGASSLAMLRVITGGDTVLITLRQPANAMGFNSQEALVFLSGVASKSNLGVVERKAQEQVKKDTQGDVPPAPPTNTVNEVGDPSKVKN